MTDLIARVAEKAGWTYARMDGEGYAFRPGLAGAAPSDMADSGRLTGDGLVLLLRELLEAGGEVWKNEYGYWYMVMINGEHKMPNYAADTLEEAVMQAYLQAFEGKR